MGRSQVTPKQLCSRVMEYQTPTTMTVLAITGFEIFVEDAGTYAHISADVDVVVGCTSYGEQTIVPKACQAKVLLADDTDLDLYRHKTEQMELAEDVSQWEYVDNPS